MDKITTTRNIAQRPTTLSIPKNTSMFPKILPNDGKKLPKKSTKCTV